MATLSPDFWVFTSCLAQVISLQLAMHEVSLFPYLCFHGVCMQCLALLGLSAMPVESEGVVLQALFSAAPAAAAPELLVQLCQCS